MGTNVSNEIVITRGLEMIDDMQHKPDRYSVLIKALQDASKLSVFHLQTHFDVSAADDF